jgi:wyosine [tRNA(Phe)-imidazoG37] synthetase (radical SAM superfamily)
MQLKAVELEGRVPGRGVHQPPAPRYHIERAAKGYRVVGPGLLLWEPTLREAVDWRVELEAPGWRQPLVPPIRGERTVPLESIVYGPVASRRLGRSLGLNLTPPGCRVCNFKCAYCYAQSPASHRAARWPAPEEVGGALAEALAKARALDSITISGDGEPTLHPRFPDVVAHILTEARRARRRVPVRILTNGSGAVRPDVRAALDRLDERVVKLDADPVRVSRPSRRHPLGAIILGIGFLRDVTLQSCFVEGAVSNTADGAIRDWVQLVGEINPRAVQIYTIDRRPAHPRVRPVSPAHLEEIACSLRAQTGIEACVYA